MFPHSDAAAAFSFLARPLRCDLASETRMTIPPLDTRKFTIDQLPLWGQPQGSRSMAAITALPVQGNDQAPSSDDKLTTAARQLVGSTFFGTLLKQMHDSPFKSELFSGGRGEEAFSPLMDQQMIDRMSRTAGDKLVKRIVKQFHKNALEAEENRKDVLDVYRKQKEPGHVSTDRRA